MSTGLYKYRLYLGINRDGREWQLTRQRRFTTHISKHHTALYIGHNGFERHDLRTAGNLLSVFYQWTVDQPSSFSCSSATGAGSLCSNRIMPHTSHIARRTDNNVNGIEIISFTIVSPNLYPMKHVWGPHWPRFALDTTSVPQAHTIEELVLKWKLLDNE